MFYYWHFWNDVSEINFECGEDAFSHYLMIEMILKG
jgi:hypothetical protein